MADDNAQTIPKQEFGPMGERDRVPMTLRDTTANSGALGLMAFGLTTVLLNVNNAGLIPMSGMILAMAAFCGGMGAVTAGLMEWKKNSTFGMTAFLLYGFFLLTFVGIYAFPKWIGSAGLELGATSTAIGYYLLAWSVFSGLMYVGTLRIDRATQTIFLGLTVLFLLLAIGAWTGNEMITKIAGWVGIFTGAVQIYASIAQIWNELYGRVVLPLGPYKKK